ncbi:hypothetical protein CLU79DRAFT_440108 [Phycomyces nitens]|nr:hypothetical protein CLU79DRAFT_440108 [Phycomyces nitens]
MSQYRIPFEIIEYIARFIEFKDKLQCALVCKYWSLKFTELIWKKINISSQRQLEDICNSQIPKHIIYRNNGHHVHELHLEVSIDANDIQLYTLQQYFPNIRRLIVEHEAFIGDDFARHADWNLWKCLTEMSLNLDTVDIFITDMEFQGILSCIPHLQWLHIIQNNEDDTKRVNLQCFELIHSHLQKLKYIDIDMDFEEISDTDLSIIPRVLPAKSLTTLITPVYTTEYRWIYYFAMKYPNLHTMKTNTDEVDRQFYECPSDLPNLSTSQSLFNQLKNLDIVISDNQDSLRRNWAKVLSDDMPLNHIDLTIIELPPKEPLFPDYIFNQYVQPYSARLESFTVRIHGPISRLFNTTTLNSCPRLTTLTLCTHLATISLSTILDHYQSLTRLIIDSSQVITGESQSEIPTTHRLSILGVRSASFRFDFLAYVSNRCRDLKYISMHNVHICFPIYTRTRHLCIDMSHTHLKYLVHSNVRYNISEMMYGADYSINFVHLSLIDRCPQQTEDINIISTQKILAQYTHGIIKDYNDNPMNKSSSKIESDPIWFYSTYSRCWSNVWESVTWQLRRDEIETATEYFKNVSGRDFPMASAFENSGNIHGSRGKWDLDLFRGFVTLKFGSIAKYEFPSLSVGGNYNWDEEYVNMI